MGFFSRKSADEKVAEEAAEHQRETDEADALASQQSLMAGGLPLKAKKRLEELRTSGGLFTSDLSVNEFRLARSAGVTPLAQVMGSSVYHVGWQNLPRNTIFGWYQQGSLELTVRSHAWNEARRLALSRLEQEAAAVGADTVVGVRITRGAHEFAAHAVEFIAFGTAVSRDDAPPAEKPLLSNLSGQDFWKLKQAGATPLGIVAGSTVYYVAATWATRQATNSSWFGSGRQNQELVDFTRGVYDARETAIGHVTQQAIKLGAAGVVGVTIDQHEETYEWEDSNDNRHEDLIVTFHVIGTAISTPDPAAPGLDVTAILDQSTQLALGSTQRRIT